MVFLYAGQGIDMGEEKLLFLPEIGIKLLWLKLGLGERLAL